MRSQVHAPASKPTKATTPQRPKRDEFRVVFPEDHPGAAFRDPVRSARLVQEALILPEQNAGTLEVARRGRFSPQIIGSPGSLFAVLAQVSRGSGISIVPSVAATTIRIPNIAFRALAGGPVRSEVAAIFRTRETSPAVKNFILQITQTPPVDIRLNSELS